MQVSLSNRLADMAQRAQKTGAPLTQADVDQISAETGASAKEIRSGFMEALRALEGGISANESAGSSSQTLRSALGDGVGIQYEGQKVAGAGTPSLKGFNLKVPGEEKAPPALAGYEQMAQALQELAAGLASGDLDEMAAKSVLGGLKQPDAAATTALWEPAGEAVRAAVNAAVDAVAAVAPQLKLPGDSPLTFGEGSLQAKLTNAIAAGDTGLKEQLAQQFVDQFPDSALAPWARSEAVHDPLKGMDFDRAVGLLEVYASGGGMKAPDVDVPPQGFQFLVEVLSSNKYKGFDAPARLPKDVSVADLEQLCDVMSKLGDIDGPNGGMRAQDWLTLKDMLPPFEGLSALPTFRSGAHTLGDEASLVLRGGKVMVDTRFEKKLLAQGFEKVPGTELLQPPLDDQGFYQQGTYELPGYSKLVIGDENDAKLDVSRMIDYEYDDVMRDLPKAGFIAGDDKAQFSLPRES
jgi:hypothetical protein